jgi:DNA helicase-2/ATP-dependent DNA helicase PcrA
MKEFVIEQVANFYLSPTSLNAYLECPQAFFYNQLLRVPKVKDFSQCYGTAVHKALELFFKKFIRDFKLPVKQDLLNFYTKSLRNEILKPQDLKRALVQGKENLSLYYNFYQKEWKKSGPPINAEYNFGSHNVFFESLPITGKIDKIQLLDSIAKKVRITDYKTSQPKSLNQILGKTSTKDYNELNQAYFYKLLSENDPNFSWQISEIEFDFISPKDGKFRKVKVPIEKEEYEKFKKLLKEVYTDIKKMRFEPTKDTKTCQKWGYKCEYFDLCEELKTV